MKKKNKALECLVATKITYLAEFTATIDYVEYRNLTSLIHIHVECLVLEKFISEKICLETINWRGLCYSLVFDIYQITQQTIVCIYIFLNSYSNQLYLYRCRLLLNFEYHTGLVFANNVR